MRVGVDRLDGYRDVLSTAGLPENISIGDFSEESGERGMRELLTREPKLDAVFAASDPMAVGAMRVLKEHGLRIPGDVALVGFDDSATARHTDPPLTSVHQPLETMGREMARLLVARIRGDVIENSMVILDTHLVTRGSSCAPH
jgi:DNA-binding LacI/PurR family transcriptional regulator